MRAVAIPIVVALLLPLVASSAGASESASLPVVVAVDASRSLRPAELTAARQQLEAIVSRLPGEATGGLLVFADDAEWVRPLGTRLGDIPAALAEVRPSGNFTLLHDALFTAAKALDNSGGVILLVTDGRDENSATTIEDVARRCEAAGVAVVAIGLGGRQDDRALRRIALLTSGTFVGPLAGADPAAVAREVDSARVALAAQRQDRTQAQPAVTPAAPQPTAVVPESPQPVPAAAATPPQSFPVLPFTLMAAGLLAALAILAVVLRRRSGPAAPDADPRATALELELRAAEERELQLALRDRPVASPDETAEIAIPKDLRDDLPDDDPFEKTRVLAQRSLLFVREPGLAPKSLVLRGDRGFGVGRDAHGNTLRIGDPALSGRHFKVVPEGESYVLVDLGSTNGTYVNRERVRARRLASGDTIHAGQVEFEFRTFDQPLN